MDRHELTTSLIEDFGYPTRAADVVAERILRGSPEMREGFQHLRSTGVLPALCIAGYTVDRLIREHDMKPVAALLMIDWLLCEPERAAASLRKGHDHATSQSSRTSTTVHPTG
jgi:hypothetical protein